MVKRIIAISLLSLFLISSTELNQLLKLPVLFEHFTEHKELNRKISFFDFLCMHYSSNNDDDDRDMQLPFKSHDNYSVQITVVIPRQEPLSFDFIPAFDKNFSLDKNFNFSSSFLSNIWQPPKIG